MDVDSFKRLFLPLHPKLFRIAYALVENKADAEDILQDAYYKLWSRREELANVLNPEAFCVTLVKNLCLDYLRSPRANRHDEDVAEAVTLSTDSSPDKELEMQDKVEHIRYLISRLPENQRQVIRLRGIDDCSMDEIEQITGLNAVNIRVLLSRARKIIREQFDKYYAHEYER
ncbi:RNA polymerase sigma factor [Parabacteroides sp. AF17-28]|jgi:RNA polymerase sigma-70 factor (ECF subfamily)|uniref:RNA polymerase sigma factor n=1 Tax=Parabacteroides sp. AF17-28 TaxID=2292241 RepID=UPI000EFEFF1A|nr:RNA polymerase sigma factor [Parabacteroides sp. AF17-28]RHR50398.1 RNA polymerase sigma factor [Parabacteroides sp. AF17-28]